MSLGLIVYLVGVLPSAVIAAAISERERRESHDLLVREATLRPGLDGIVCGICWPLVAAFGVVVGAIALVAFAGRVAAR